MTGQTEGSQTASIAVTGQAESSNPGFEARHSKFMGSLLSHDRAVKGLRNYLLDHDRANREFGMSLSDHGRANREFGRGLFELYRTLNEFRGGFCDYDRKDWEFINRLTD